MAIIQKIRDKYAKLAGGVIVVALVGFILTDLGKSNGRIFGDSTTVGKINGEKIDYTVYEARINQRKAEIQSQNPNMQFDENQEAQLRDQVWNEMVAEHLMADVEEKLGISVGKAEMMDMFTGPNPDPQVRQTFTNPQTGQFNPQEVAAAYQQYEKTSDPKMKEQWAGFKSQLSAQRLRNKFNNMVTGVLYTPKAILDEQHQSRNTLASVNYVQLPFSLIPDDQVKVTDGEIQKFMEDHRAIFEQKEASRSAEVVSFDLIPSHADSVRMFTLLDTLKPQFAATQDDEAFINLNSENPFPPAYQTSKTLKSLPNAEELMTAPAGTVVGPFNQGEEYMLAKIEEKKSFPDSVKVRHILVIMSQQGQQVLSDTAAKARIDSVAAMIKAGVPFDSLVVRYSDDPGSKAKGGVYDFPLEAKGSLTKEFGDFAFDGKAGESKVVKVESQGYNGYHYIEILKQGAPVASSKIAFISKKFQPSDATNQELYAKANDFASKAAKGGNAFDKEALAAGVSKNPVYGINKNSSLVPGMGASKEMVKWAYEAKENEVSPIFIINGNYVVARLTGILEPGLPKINAQIRSSLEMEIKRQKKAQLLMDKTKGKGSLEAIAQSEGQQVAKADSISFYSGNNTVLGNEPKVLGYAFNKSFKENTVSPAIPGNMGVYYFTVNSRTSLADATPRNPAMEQQMSSAMLRNSAPNMILNSMQEAADVEDMRGKIYNR